jgi:hypothetical protein
MVALQRRLLNALCQDSLQSATTIDEAWLLNALGDLAIDPEWFGRFCNWQHEGQTLLDRARSIANFSAKIKTHLLADFENDLAFEALFDPEAQGARDLVGLAPLRALDPQAAEVVHRFFESFYNPSFYTGYRIPTAGNSADFTRRRFVQDFQDCNSDLSVCPMCDGDLGNAKVDHFFPRAAYPYLSVHPLNLVPICDDCNGPGGKHETPPLSPNATGHHTDDWFHPYLRSACGTYTIGFEEHQAGTTPILTGATSQTQRRLTNLTLLCHLDERWRRALSWKTRIAQNHIRRAREDLGRSLTEGELCERLEEWAHSAEDEIGLESFALIKTAYFQSASQKVPTLFNELWIYNAPNADVVTASSG